jgi:DNA-binding NtrC family response regulator
MKYSIMFVDDNPGVLESLRWIFMDEPYQFFASDRSTEALRATETTEFAVVVTDQSMPEMSGIELLKRIKAQSPATVRLIMSVFPEVVGYSGNGLVYRFIQKPWHFMDLKQTSTNPQNLR